MDPDHYKVPLGAASEGGRVLQTVSQSRLQLTPASYARWCGDSHEAVGVQREAGHVHVSGLFTPTSLPLSCVGIKVLLVMMTTVSVLQIIWNVSAIIF